MAPPAHRAADTTAYLRENRVADVIEGVLGHILSERPDGRAATLEAVLKYAANELKAMGVDSQESLPPLAPPRQPPAGTPTPGEGSFSFPNRRSTYSSARNVIHQEYGTDAPGLSKTVGSFHHSKVSPNDSQPLLLSHRLSLACASVQALESAAAERVASEVTTDTRSANNSPKAKDKAGTESPAYTAPISSPPASVTNSPDANIATDPCPDKLMDNIRTRALATATQDVRRVVFTGGPCAGKSTGLSLIKQELERRGFHALVVPEVASIMFEAGAGIAFNEPSDTTIHAFQSALFKLQCALEDSMCEIAKACGRPAVVLCDRGALDGKAFCVNTMWDDIMAASKTDTESVRDGRYDLVIHLVTAAEGAEDFYTLENNVNRTETPEEAISQDHKLREMWSAHPMYTLVDNSTGFDAKLQRAMTSLMRLVGLDHKIKATAKFTLHNPPAPEDIPVPYKTSYVLIHVLLGTTDNFIHRLYKRVTNNGVTYSRQVIRKVGEEMQKVEEMLTEKGHMGLLHTADSDYDVISRVILSFRVEQQQYELALSGGEGCGYLYAEADGEGEVSLPPWILEREEQEVEECSSPRMAKTVKGSSAVQDMLSAVPRAPHDSGDTDPLNVTAHSKGPSPPCSPPLVSNSLFTMQSGYGWNLNSPPVTRAPARPSPGRSSVSSSAASSVIQTSEIPTLPPLKEAAPKGTPAVVSELEGASRRSTPQDPSAATDARCFSPSMVDITPVSSTPLGQKQVLNA